MVTDEAQGETTFPIGPPPPPLYQRTTPTMTHLFVPIQVGMGTNVSGPAVAGNGKSQVVVELQGLTVFQLMQDYSCLLLVPTK